MNKALNFEQWHNAETENYQEICPYKGFERSAWNAAIRQCVKIIGEDKETDERDRDYIDSLIGLLSHE